MNNKSYMKVLLIMFLILSLSTYAYAGQRIVNVYEQVEWGGRASFLEHDCKSFCADKSEDINSLLRSGYRIVGSGYKEINVKPFKNNDTYCRCIGAEYILER